MESLENPEDQEVIMNGAQVLHERGRQQGVEEGIEQGIEKGIERALRSQRVLLLKLIERKFGAPSEAISAKIDDADADAIAEWTLALLDAVTVEQIFGA